MGMNAGENTGLSLKPSSHCRATGILVARLSTGEVVVVLSLVVAVLSETSVNEDVSWGVTVQLHVFLTVALGRRDWSASRPGLPNPGTPAPVTY